MRRLILTALLLAPGACTAVTAPSSALGVNYHFASTGGEADRSGPATDTDISAWEITYELMPFGSNNNIAVSYLRREDDLQHSGERFHADIWRAQLRWHYALAGPLTWYVGPGLGFVFSMDHDGAPNADYSAAWYYDAELGLRCAVWNRFGIQGLLNYGVLKVDGVEGTSHADLTGLTAGAGVYVDF